LYVLGIDPGITTGLALVTTGGHLTWATESRAPFDELRGAFSQYQARLQLIVAEGMPVGSGHHRSVFDEVVSVIDECTPRDVEWIMPSAWKPHPASRLTELDLQRCNSPHEKDAVGIARYALALTTYIKDSA
jgi:hypothetical protein